MMEHDYNLSTQRLREDSELEGRYRVCLRPVWAILWSDPVQEKKKKVSLMV
jgi:hypothetical protein